MGRIVVFFFLFAQVILPDRNAYATHAAGADLQYTWITGRTYLVTVSFYRDCNGVAAPPSISLNARSSSCGLNQDYTLNVAAGSGQEITFPCFSVQTKCTNSGSAYIGYQKYEYTNLVTLPQSCSDWIFSFYVCCRNCAITTLASPCSDNMYIEATLNNLAAPTNSSPRFTNVPVAFLCTNQSSTYNHGVIDINGDSLVYSFITPLTFNTATSTVGTVTFNPGYSASQPLTSSPAVTINPLNGDITVFPTTNGEIGVTAILIREYRNGVLIGSVIRDMQFLTKVCNPNFLPSASGINGTSVFDTTVCPGSLISFNVNSSDPNPGDTVTMTWNNAIGGATFNTTAAPLPVGTFSWTPAIGDARPQPYLFTVTVRDNACPTNASQTVGFIIRIPLLTANISSPTFNGYNIACQGGSTGSATVTTNGGSVPYSYSWSPTLQTTQTAVNLAPGGYTVTVTDAHGCTKTATATLTEPPTITSINVISATNVSCNGGSNGSGIISGSGGIGPYSYLWTPGGQTTAMATGLAANVYTARVTDQNGCTAQQAIAITQPPILNPVVNMFQNVSCQGNANGSIDISVSGGTSPYTHHWSSGQTTSTITGLGPGTYRDTVTDSKGCIQVVSQVITQPGTSVGIPSSSVSTTGVSCYGLNDGTANVNPLGGTLPYVVTWSNGDNGNTADSLPGGNISVHIVDGNGCTFDSVIAIPEPAALAATFTGISIAPSGTNIACFGDTTGKVKVLPAGGTIPYAFNWSNGSIVDSIFNVQAGQYIVDITDFNGCVFTDTIDLSEPSLLDDSLVVKDAGCKGEASGGIRVFAYDGAGPYTYTWSHGSFTTDTVGDLLAGLYEVTITDTNGCQKTDTVTVQEPSVLVPLLLPSSFIGAINVACNGDSTGSATINLFGGTSPFNYAWSTGGVDSFVTGLTAGNVSVHVVDANGCSITRDTTLTEPPPFSYTTIVQNPFCYGDTSGYIVLNAAGSTGPYNYTWSNGDSNDSTGALVSGVYSVIVRDANNCPDSSGFVLSDPDTLIAHATLSDYQGFNTACTGDSSGTIALHVTGGNGTYTYLWNTSETSDSIGNLTGSNYSVTILDGNGCRKDTTFALTQPPVMTPGISVSVFNGGSNVSCFGFIDGYAHSSVSGGVPPYQYLWSNGDVADSALGLGAGPNTLNVTDSNGCSMTFPFNLTQPTVLSTNPSLSNFNGFNVSCFGDSTGCITVSAGGGNGPYLYVWDFQDTITSTTLCNLPADTFSVRVIDANGCQLDTTFILNSPQSLSDSTVLSAFGGFEIQCAGLSNGSIDLNVLGGVAPFTFNWSTADTSEDLQNLTAGNYQVIITDANSCVDTIDYILSEPTVLSDILSATNSTCGMSNGTAMVTAAGGVSPYSYSWSNGDVGINAANLSQGFAVVQITDTNGCMAVDSILIGGSPPFNINFNVTNAFCAGINNGSAQIILSGGTPPYQINWSNGDTGTIADSLGGGYVLVDFADQIGCMGTDSVNIIQLTGLTSSIANLKNITCNGDNDGSVTINPVTGGSPPYTYSWSNGDIGFTADSLSGGPVSVTVSDANSCLLTINATIIDPPPFIVTASLQDLSCDDTDDGRISVQPSGGALPYFYNWSPAVSSDSVASDLHNGNYSVLITDNFGCIDTVFVTIGISDCDPELPTGFSPNGDGKNDSFIIHGLSKFPNNTFKVFNRWGNEVFSVENYSNIEWYGQNSHGEELPEGTYYVIFVSKNGNLSLYSYVDLRR